MESNSMFWNIDPIHSLLGRDCFLIFFEEVINPRIPETRIDRNGILFVDRVGFLNFNEVIKYYVALSCNLGASLRAASGENLLYTKFYIKLYKIKLFYTEPKL